MRTLILAQQVWASLEEEYSSLKAETIEIHGELLHYQNELAFLWADTAQPITKVSLNSLLPFLKIYLKAK